MQYRALKLIMLALAVLTLASCGDDDHHTVGLVIPGEAVYDIVTLESTSAKGTVFTMRLNEDLPLITYHAAVNMSNSENVKEGMRLLICYNRIDGATYTSGNIKMYGYTTLSNTEPAVICKPRTEAEKMGRMKIESLWRTGQYINMQVCIFVTEAKRPEEFVLVADESTLDSAYPELYLTYRNIEDNDGDNAYDIRASFDISQVWDLPTCRGVYVHYNTPAGVSMTVFSKSN